MNHRLTDIERGLLSAYVDGEVNGAEQARAEQLLAGSEEARRYLGELEAVDKLSSQFIAVPLSAGALTAVSKITASSIKAAAGSGAAKAGLFGSWGTLTIGGLVTAAAVTVGVVFWPGPGADRQGAGTTQVSSPLPVMHAMNLDTSSVIVPEMTPVELATFAVDGTLPIGDARKQFITLASQSADSIAVALHSVSTQSELVHQLARVEPSRVSSYDSLLRMSRLAVLRSSDGALAVSPAVPELRLRILRALAHTDRDGLPTPSRVRVDQLEGELLQVQERRLEGGDGNASFADLCASLDGRRDSRYILISMPNGEVLRSQDLEAIAPAQPFTVSIDFARGPAVSIESSAFRTIGRYAFAPTAPTPFAEAAPYEDLPVISVGGGAPRQRVSRVERSRPATPVMNVGGDPARTPDAIPVPEHPSDNERAQSNSEIPAQQDPFDSLNRQIQLRIQRAHERLMKIQMEIERNNSRDGGDGTGGE